jgi:hypothetical protein
MTDQHDDEAIDEPTTPGEPDPPPSPSLLRGLQESLVILNTTMHSLIERLDVVGDSNDEIAKWRRRATYAIRGLVAAVVVVVLLGTLVWHDGVQRDKASQAEADAEIDRVNEQRLTGCRLRNDAQRDDRAQWFAVFDTLAGLGLSARSVDALRASIDEPEDEDVDCDGDGMLTAADYA